MKEKNSQLRRHRHTPYIKPYSGPYSSKHVNFCDTQNHAKTCVLESDKHSLLSVISNNDNESKMSAKKMQWILRCQKVDENSEELQKIWKHRDNSLWEKFPTSSGASHCLLENGDLSKCSNKAADARLQPIPVLPEQQKKIYETPRVTWRASFEGVPLRLSRLIKFQIMVYESYKYL